MVSESPGHSALLPDITSLKNPFTAYLLQSLYLDRHRWVRGENAGVLDQHCLRPCCDCRKTNKPCLFLRHTFRDIVLIAGAGQTLRIIVTIGTPSLIPGLPPKRASLQDIRLRYAVRVESPYGLRIDISFLDRPVAQQLMLNGACVRGSDRLPPVSNKRSEKGLYPTIR